jgi:glycosyltransferase involved in cell wall biosynthesis
MFLATEDWFFQSHFLMLARKAKADGYDPVLICNVSGDLPVRAEIRIVPLAFPRGALTIGALFKQARAYREVIERERPMIVHAIGLKPILAFLLSGASGLGRVLAVTGRGYLSVRRSFAAHVGSGVLRGWLRFSITAPRTVLMLENQRDRRWIESGFPISERRIAMMPGAGVDPDQFRVAPEPPPSPIRVGIASRLVWSKGFDLAIEALEILRRRGHEVELWIAGGVDPENPEHVADELIERWRATPGVRLLGHVSDINSFWAQVHVACLASRGGEGLPRTILEAGACGRPFVVTAVPGCEDFVVDGEMGFVCPPEDVRELAAAIEKLALDGVLRRRMGAAARARIEAHYTTAHAAAVASHAWSAVAGD